MRTPGMVWLVYPLLFLETIGAAFFEPAHSAVIPNIVPEAEVLAGERAGLHHLVVLPGGRRLAGRHRRGAARTRRGLPAERVLVSGLGVAHPPDALRGAAHRRAAAAARARPGRLLARSSKASATSAPTAASSPRCSSRAASACSARTTCCCRSSGSACFRAASRARRSRAAMLGMSMLMGARGVGALIGPLIGGRWAGDSHSRLRTGILVGFLLAAAGYLFLGLSQSLALAVAAVIVAHAGSSTNWVFSTTLLQVYTTDRFRGRVFAADFGLCMLGISASSYLAGVAIDWGLPARDVRGRNRAW